MRWISTKKRKNKFDMEINLVVNYYFSKNFETVI